MVQQLWTCISLLEDPSQFPEFMSGITEQFVDPAPGNAMLLASTGTRTHTGD